MKKESKKINKDIRKARESLRSVNDKQLSAIDLAFEDLKEYRQKVNEIALKIDKFLEIMENAQD